MKEHPFLQKAIENCNLAIKAQPLRKYIIHSCKDLSQLPTIGNFIYVITEIGGNPEKTFQKFKVYKDKKERKCARLNDPASILYVGSSTTGVGKRLKQHLDEAPEGTYALHMSHWFDGKVEIEIIAYDVELEILQLIEDSISHNLRPAFGKQGGNNK